MTDYGKLKSIVDEIDNLIEHNVMDSVPAFEAWHTKAERFLIKKYGKDSLEHKKFLDINFSPLIWVGDDEEQLTQESIEWCCNGLKTCKAVFETYLEDIADEVELLPVKKTEVKLSNMDKIFIVHGHDREMKNAVARIIAEQEIKPIILSEQANQGRTIIEKFEDYSDVGGAICLFTADDVGKAKSESEETKTEAEKEENVF